MIITLYGFKKKAPHKPLIFYGGGAKNGSLSCLLKLFYSLIKAS